MKTRFILLTLTLILVGSASCELRYVFNLFSNGAKEANFTSLNSLNEDKYGERWNNPDELTAVGVRQLYLLG